MVARVAKGRRLTKLESPWHKGSSQANLVAWFYFFSLVYRGRKGTRIVWYVPDSYKPAISLYIKPGVKKTKNITWVVLLRLSLIESLMNILA